MKLALRENNMGSYLQLQDKIDWQDPPNRLSLSESTVHVWYGALQSGFNYAAHTELLSLKEKIRAKQFRFELDQKKFVARRAILRIILNLYSNIAPNDIEIESDIYGKSKITSDVERVVFSLSHSRDSVIYAITRNLGLGIDIEYIKEINAETILAILFSCTTGNKIKSYQCIDNMRFYALWTSLEAYLKAIGTGFRQPLDDEFWSNFPIEIGSRELKDPNWSVVQFFPEKGFLSTLVVKAPEIEIEFFNLLNIVESGSS